LYGECICARYVRATGSHTLIKLSKPRKIPTPKLALNINAYEKGAKPVGFLNWPNTRVHVMENIIVDIIQHRIDYMQGACAHQHQYPESEDEGENLDDIEEHEEDTHA